MKQYRAKHQSHVDRTIAEAINLGLTRIGLTVLLIIVAILALASLVTTYIFPYTNYETPFNSLTYALVSFPALIVIVLVLLRCNYDKWIDSKRIIHVCTAVSVIFSIIWVAIFSSYPPTADQWSAVECARLLFSKDFSALEQSGALQIYPFQSGLVLWNELIGTLFGFTNWTAFRLIGCASVPLIVFFLARTAGLLFNNQKVSSVTAILAISFLPLSCYATFIYGTLPSLAASIIAFYFQARSIRIKNNKRKSLIFGVLSCLMFFAALFFKLNSLVLLIAAEIISLVTSISRKHFAYLLLFFLNIGVYFASSVIPCAVIEHRTGIDLGSGVPKTAWIVMGMQESVRPSGWYNGYVTQYWSTAIDGSEQSYREADAQLSSDLSERIQEFAKDPAYAIDFFARKALSQWSEPTFQSLWCSFTGVGTVSDDGLLPGISASFDESSLLQRSLLSGTLHKVYVVYCDAFQSLVYVLICIGLYSQIKENVELDSALFAITLFGGFLFHMVWEAKSCYTLVYFILALPIGAYGLVRLRGMISAANQKKRT